jgi:hypothetical protein
MEKSRIIISGLWAALMPTYLLGDVLRIFAGDFEPGKLNGKHASEWIWLGMAALMLIPIAMIVLTLTVNYPAIRWVNIIVTAVVIVFNIFGLPYKGVYDNFLIGGSFILNGLSLWHAWHWNLKTVF